MNYLRDSPNPTAAGPALSTARLRRSPAAVQHSKAVPSARTISEKQTYPREEIRLISLNYETAVYLSPKLYVFGDKTIKIGTWGTICQK